MLFTEELFQMAIDSTNNLLQHPISNIFKINFCPTTTLETVLQNLKLRLYKDVYTWEFDIENAIWAIEKEYPQNIYVGYAAKELRKIFNKERKFLAEYSTIIWLRYFDHLKNKLSDIVYSSIHETRKKKSQNIIDSSKLDVFTNIEHETQLLIIGLETLETDENKNEVIELVKKIEKCDGDENNKLNHHQILSNDSFETMKVYINSCISKKGLNSDKKE